MSQPFCLRQFLVLDMVRCCELVAASNVVPVQKWCCKRKVLRNELMSRIQVHYMRVLIFERRLANAVL